MSGRKNRETINIEFARGLSAEQLNTILQLELIRARTSSPPEPEVTLPTQIVHEIKFRLNCYKEIYGEPDRDEFFARKNEHDGS